MSERLDDLARALAGPMPRSRVLGILGGAVLTAVTPAPLRGGPARAEAPGVCDYGPGQIPPPGCEAGKTPCWTFRGKDPDSDCPIYLGQCCDPPGGGLNWICCKGAEDNTCCIAEYHVCGTRMVPSGSPDGHLIEVAVCLAKCGKRELCGKRCCEHDETCCHPPNKPAAGVCCPVSRCDEHGHCCWTKCRTPHGTKCCPREAPKCCGDRCCKPNETCGSYGSSGNKLHICCKTKSCQRGPGSKPFCCPRKTDVCTREMSAGGDVPRDAPKVCCPAERVVRGTSSIVGCCPEGTVSLGGKFSLAPGVIGGSCCPVDQVCGSGSSLTCCPKTAEARQECCNGVCIDVRFDASNCGSCGRRCVDVMPECRNRLCVCRNGECSFALP